MRRFAAIAAVCAGAAFAAGCSSPPSHFYVLSNVAPPAAPAPAPTGLSVSVGPVSIPASVDVPQFVVSAGTNRVSIDEFNRWASPLQNNIARVVAEDLVAMLGTPHVSLFPSSLNADPGYRVVIEIQRFESMPGEAALLDAVWTVRRTKDGKVQTGRSTVREPTADASYEALAAAHSRALGRMSQDIAEAVRALDRSAG